MYLAYISPLNKFTHPNVHRSLPPAGPILHAPHCTFSYGPYFGESTPISSSHSNQKFGSYHRLLLLHQLTKLILPHFCQVISLVQVNREVDNDLASYNIFLTGFSASSLVIPSNLSFHIAARVIFL